MRANILRAALLAGACAFAACASDSDEEAWCEGVSARTNIVSDHRHSVCVPAADIVAEPPAGGTYETTHHESHLHEVTLVAEQLAALHSEHTVLASTSIAQDHKHSVIFVGKGVYGGP